MNAQQVIDQVTQQGLSLAANGGKLIISGTGNKQTQLTPELKQLLINWKPKLVSLLSRNSEVKVIRLVVDGKAVTCIDPTSKTDSEAITRQRQRWGDRLSYIRVR